MINLENRGFRKKKGVSSEVYLFHYKYVGNEHWVTFAGLDENGNIIVLCSNGGDSRQMIISDEFGDDGIIVRRGKKNYKKVKL